MPSKRRWDWTWRSEEHTTVLEKHVLLCSELGGDCEHHRGGGFMPPFLSFVGASLGHHFWIAWLLSHVLLVIGCGYGLVPTRPVRFFAILGPASGLGKAEFLFLPFSVML